MAHAVGYTISPPWGSDRRSDCGGASEPTAHAAGYTMSPRWGSEARHDGGPAPKPAAHAAGYTMSPRGGFDGEGDVPMVTTLDVLSPGWGGII
jgi:hypothetical protein